MLAMNSAALAGRMYRTRRMAGTMAGLTRLCLVVLALHLSPSTQQQMPALLGHSAHQHVRRALLSSTPEPQGATLAPGFTGSSAAAPNPSDSNTPSDGPYMRWLKTTLQMGLAALSGASVNTRKSVVDQLPGSPNGKGMRAAAATQVASAPVSAVSDMPAGPTTVKYNQLMDLSDPTVMARPIITVPDASSMINPNKRNRKQSPAQVAAGDMPTSNQGGMFRSGTPTDNGGDSPSGDSPSGDSGTLQHMGSGTSGHVHPAGTSSGNALVAHYAPVPDSGTAHTEQNTQPGQLQLQLQVQRPANNRGVRPKARGRASNNVAATTPAAVVGDDTLVTDAMLPPGMDMLVVTDLRDNDAPTSHTVSATKKSPAVPKELLRT